MASTTEIYMEIADDNVSYTVNSRSSTSTTVDNDSLSQNTESCVSQESMLNSESEMNSLSSVLDSAERIEMDVDTDRGTQSEESTSSPVIENDDVEIKRILRLSQQDKINRNNAFSMNIDNLLGKIILDQNVDNRAEEWMDGLDACVKVYVNKVDSLAEEIENEVRAMDLLKANKTNQTNEENDSSVEAGRKRRQTRKKKPILLEDPTSVCASNAEKDKGRIKYEIQCQRDYLKPMKEIMFECNLNPYTLMFELDGNSNISKSRKVDASAYKMVDISGFDFYEGREITILPEFDLTIDNGPLPPVSNIYKYPLDYSEFSLEEWSDLEETCEVEENMNEIEEESNEVEGSCMLDLESSDLEEDASNKEPATELDDVAENERMEYDEPIAEDPGSNSASIVRENEPNSLQQEQEEAETENIRTTQDLTDLVSNDSEYSFFNQGELRNWREANNVTENDWCPPGTETKKEEKRAKKKEVARLVQSEDLQYNLAKRVRVIKRYMRLYKTFDLKAARQKTPYWNIFDDYLLWEYSTWNQKKIDGLPSKKRGCNSEEDTDAGNSTLEEEEKEADQSMCDEGDNETDQSTCTEGEKETDQSSCMEEEAETEESTCMDDSFLNESEDTFNSSSDMLQQERIFEEAEIVEENSVQLLGASSVITPTKIVVNGPELEPREQLGNIMKLKSDIWDILKKKVERGREVPFSYVLKRLLVNKDDITIVFHALLHLANEKRLDISGYPELYIKFIPPRVEVGQSIV